MNSSYFLCEQILQINQMISSAICDIGNNIFHSPISFTELIKKLNNTIYIQGDSFNLFSFDGMIKGFFSTSLFNLLFSYSLRYILIKLFILLMPFSILTLLMQSSSWFFKTWLRAFLSLLIIQSFVALILLIIFSMQFDSTKPLNKLLCIGSIYSLIRANSFVKELVGGVTTTVNSQLTNLRSVFKH